ncbi:MAG: DUF1501 domain-containing protein [Planctomycetaceae bacterium]
MPASSCPDFRRVPRRREILRLGGLGMLGLGLPDLLAARDARAAAPLPSFGRATRCIFLFMWGGPSQLETWDPKPDAPREVRGEFRPIATRIPGVRIGEHFPRLAARADRLCLVRSMTHDSGDHTKATSFLLTGEPPTPGDDRRAQWPNLGSTLSALGRSRGSLPPVVQMRPRVPGDVPRFVEQSQGQFAGWLGGAHDPFTIDDDPSAPGYRVPDMELSGELSVERLDDRMRLLGALDRRIAAGREGAGLVDDYRRRAFDLLAAAATEKGAFDLARESDAVRDRYGRNPHGQSVLQARRLVERGVPLVTVFWPNDGITNVSVYWDTHARNFVDHRERLMPPADMAFAALLDDLEERGLLDETIVVWTGEFGRTPRVGQRTGDAGAAADGRDHWPGCFTTVLAGGPFRRGYVHGASDRHAAFPAADPVAPRDLVATLFHALGVPEGQVLHDLAGRPQFVRPGRAVSALLA